MSTPTRPRPPPPTARPPPGRPPPRPRTSSTWDGSRRAFGRKRMSEEQRGSARLSYGRGELMPIQACRLALEPPSFLVRHRARSPLLAVPRHEHGRRGGGDLAAAVE